MIFYLEGSIGSGKSTLLSILQEAFNKQYVEVIQEPVEEWKQLMDDNNNNILSYFYQDPKRWSLSFQLNAFISRVNKLENLDQDKIYIVERSIFSDKNCFATNCYQTGLMNQLEWKIYNQWFDWLITKSNTKPSGYIYLKCHTNTCLDRIAIRNRNEENGIPEDYLTQLNDLHDNWLSNTSYPTLVLDNNYNFNQQPEIINKHINTIVDFIENTIGSKDTKKILNKLL